MPTVTDARDSETAPRPAGSGSPDVPEPGLHGWRRALRAAVPVWVTAYVAYVAVTYFAWFHPANGPAFGQLLLTWRRYDAIWYAEIARLGYDNPDRFAAPVFFPLYPALGWVVDHVLPGGTTTALQLVSAAALLATLVVFYRLVELEFDTQIAGRAIWLLMLFPTAFFLALGFNESLFMALMLGSVYAMRRSHWWLAGALGGLASLTRSVGFLLALAFVFEYLRQREFSLRRIRIDVLAVGLIPAGLAAYMLYLWAVVGDPLAFTNRMDTWGRHLAWPWTAFVQTFQWVPDKPLLHNNNLHMLLDLGLVVFVTVFVVLALVGPWKMRRDQLMLPLLGLALILYSTTFPPWPSRNEPFMGAPRYVLEAFPAFIVLARMKAMERPYTFVALMLQGVFLAHFVRNGWLA